VRALRDAKQLSSSGFNGHIYNFSSLDRSPDTARQLHSSSSPTSLSDFVLVRAGNSCKAGPPLHMRRNFRSTKGDPVPLLKPVEAGLYRRNVRRARPNLTFSYGLRFDTQRYPRPPWRVAPRWGRMGIGGSKSSVPKIVLRGGFGLFYDRFQAEQIPPKRNA